MSGIIGGAGSKSGVIGYEFNEPRFNAGGISGGVTVNQSTWTKIPFNSGVASTDAYDSHNCYDTTNYRFLPNRSGHYFIAHFGGMDDLDDTKTMELAIYKNGSLRITNRVDSGASAGNNTSNAIGSIYLNGTTDYVEAWLWHNSPNTGYIGDYKYCAFFGYRIGN